MEPDKHRAALFQEFLCTFSVIYDPEFSLPAFIPGHHAIPDAFLFEALFSRPVSLLGKFSFLSLSANRIQQGVHLRTIFFTVAFSFLVRCTFRIYFY